VCIDVLYGDVLSRRRFVEETFCRGDVLSRRRFVCAPLRTCTDLRSAPKHSAHAQSDIM
jgi:hypothetical protein